MNPLGYVQAITFLPGSDRHELLVSLRGEPGTWTVHVDDQASAVTVDGEAYTLGGLVKRLATTDGPVSFAAEEDKFRYRYATRAEFRRVAS